ncbi:secreted RxLR effector protein 161-like [Cornus florida]|uniref:secreted RxLR effector protein 161-like n=1 Tax=Cornus florida TaxID=4283 RepID=UPI0028977605|nr:secreted RxLR effector protein 161-like [Cornus florida]
MKDLGKTKFCLGLQIEHLPNGILIHLSIYTEKVLRRFYMDKAHLLSSPMVVRSHDVKKDHFRPQEDDKEILSAEVSYLSAIGALMYLPNCTKPDITFAVNLLKIKPQLIGYADAGYLSDPHTAQSQTMYLFTYGDTAISWRSMKQTMTASASSNHSEILAIHETG